MRCRLTMLCAVLLSVCHAVAAESGRNLLKNPGFEDPLETGWERRTPADAHRGLRRQESAGRTGAALILESVQPADVRLRQGHDRSLVITPGSLLELAAWVKSEQSERGEATLQIYCMDDKGGIVAQPTSVPVRGRSDWTRTRVWTMVPEGTAYVMAYLQSRNGVGRVLFDDAELVVRRPPLPRAPTPKIGLWTDLNEDHSCVRELRVLFGDGLSRMASDGVHDLRGFAGVIVLHEAEVPRSVLDQMAAFARGGGRVFMDIRNFARWLETRAVAVEVGNMAQQPLEVRMRAGLRVVRLGDANAGFTVGQVMPRAGWPDGKLLVLPSVVPRPDIEVLAVASGGEPGLIRLPLGRGCITACDVLSLREPYYRHVDAFYKYTPVSGALGNPVRFGQYYPQKFTYAEYVAAMRQLAAEFPAVRFREEGPASEGLRLYSLNLGKTDAPLYFLYAAAHGSEWEPGYGLLTFTRRVAEGKLQEVVDLERVQIKVVPYLNPWGYEHMRRQNAQGVDLNRNGEHAWEEFRGTDSNRDGRWSAGDYDWKGSAPFSEPETRTYKNIVASPRLHCVLEFHGNTSAKNNKLGILPTTARPDNELNALDLQRIANQRLRGRHLLRQNDEDVVSPYLLERIYVGGNTPQLKNTSMRDKYGLVIEVAAGYGSTYGTILQTDVVCELCRALFIAYPPPETKTPPAGK